MKRRILWPVLMLLALSSVWPPPGSAQGSPRGVQLIPPDRETDGERFDRSQSAGLFVGVRSFSHDEDLADVPYAVDDAVDLAFLFALESGSRLVNPVRVVLALSGDPQKPESRQRLELLLEAGATRHPAGQADLLRLLEQQSRLAGRDGALVVAFATHGFSDENGLHYLTAANSLLHHPETALLTSKVLEIIGRTRAARRLAFLDACRERLTQGSRSVAGDRRSTMPELLARAIAKARGQVIFFAARPGGYAFDDPERGNGLFTSSLIDGLRCAAETDGRGFVTVDTLATYVDRDIRDRLRDWGRRDRESGIEVNLGGAARAFPLAACSESPPPGSQPVSVREIGGALNVFNQEGVRLWGREIAGHIVQAEVRDLQRDGKNEVIVGVGNGGRDTGKILIFGYRGELLWSADTSAPYNYTGGHGEGLTVKRLAFGDLLGQGREQVVALSNDAQGWYQSRLTVWDTDGRLLSSFWHPGHLHRVAIGAERPGNPPRIVVAAVNNDLRGAFRAKQSIASVFCLDPRDIRGEAPPYFGRSEKGSHLWYGVLLPEGQAISRLEVLGRNGDRDARISVWSSSGHVFYLDFQGRLLSTGRSDGAEGESRFALLVESED